MCGFSGKTSRPEAMIEKKRYSVQAKRLSFLTEVKHTYIIFSPGMQSLVFDVCSKSLKQQPLIQNKEQFLHQVK